ncbi:MAG: hypothetical protein QM778_05990 [Myxococcales bacterium]
MRIPSYLLAFAAASSAALLSACGDSPATVVGGSQGSTGDGDDGSGGGGECEGDGEEECSCDGGDGEAGTGMRYCTGGYWTSCSCESSGAIVGDCKPGYYEGEFFGYYFSSYTGATSPIPVWALGGLEGKPGLYFTLNSDGEEPVPGQEFYDELTIQDGYVKGTADGLFPFEGKLTGKLDCRTLEFKATMTGGYAVLLNIPGVSTADFEGPVFGKYDVDTSSFPCQKGAKKFPKCDDDAPVLATAAVGDAVAGTKFPKPNWPSTWELKEKTTLMSPYPNIPLGGKGYWWAIWKSEGKVDTSTGGMTMTP